MKNAKNTANQQPTVTQLKGLEKKARATGFSHSQVERLYIDSVRKKYPEFFKKAQATARQVTLTKSEKKHHARFFYWLTFADIPNYPSGDPFWGKPSVQDVLKEAFIAHAQTQL